MRKIIFAVLIFAVFFAGYGLRSYNAAVRIPHADESEQATVFAKLYDTSEYKYNPNGQHGPTLYYAAALMQKLSGKTAASDVSMTDLRRSLSIFTLLIFASYILFGAYCGRGAAWGACGAFMLSSLASIYSVYFVQEILFAFFILASTLSLFVFIKRGGSAAAACAGIFAGLAQATKETSVIAFAAILCGAAAAILADKNYAVFSRRGLSGAGLAALMFAFVFVLFFSDFFTDFSGVRDAVFCYSHYFQKSADASFSGGALYYVKLLFLQKSQGVFFGELPLTLAALFGFLVSLGGRQRSLALYIGLCAVVQILILGVLTYKTPWLILSAETFLCLLAGLGVQSLLATKKTLGFAVGVAIVCALSYWQYGLSKNSSKVYCADPRNPFIYSHTVADFGKLCSRIADCATHSEYGRDIPVAFVTEQSPWPAPWILRGFKNIGYWKDSQPSDMGAYEIVVTDAAGEKKLPALADSDYETEFFGLRENLILTVRIKKTLADKVF